MYLNELFVSFQGEGPWAGVKQVFVRLAGCSLRCSYCDTPGALEPSRFCRIEREPLARRFYLRPNPLKPAEVREEILRLWGPSLHSVSLTGGEPLEQAEELADLMGLLHECSVPTYLETNGTRPEALVGIAELAGIISMDVKLHSSGGTGDLLEKHLDFLELTGDRRVFLKTVITAETDPWEAARAFAALAQVRQVPLVLQPVGQAVDRQPPDFERLAYFQRVAGDYFDEVRIIPQLHKYWKIA